MTQAQVWDVIILGGGLAGLSLARQLALARPSTRILIVEKHAFPVPEAAFKVGESSAEVGAHYFNRILGLRDHLHTDQLRKMGLRFFAPAGDNTDITRRVEFGPHRHPPIPGFQLDRGRLENFLAADAARLGIDLMTAASVRQVKLGEEEHQVVVRQDDREETVTARWVVDASGRSALLARQLDLRVPVEHDVNAVWFRIDTVIDVDEWSEDVAWHTRVPRGLRHFSTCHLVGRGYWVWLIPLAGGVTSVGIVSDPGFHSMQQLTHLDGALAWLRAHEPQLAAQVEANRERILDFKALRHLAHDRKQVYSAARWALSGEAASFSDPLYSPGSDFIAIGNTFIADLIQRDLAGENIAERAGSHNDQYLALYRNSLHQFVHQYGTLGNPHTVVAKVVWDQSYWFALPSLLFFRNRWIDPSFMRSIQPLVDRHYAANVAAQGALRAWARVDTSAPERQWVSQRSILFLWRLHTDLARSFTGDELRQRIAANVSTMEAVAEEYQRRARRAGVEPGMLTPITQAAHALHTLDPPAAEPDLEAIWLDVADEVPAAVG